MSQMSIFDQAEKKKLEGIELVYQHADSHWKREAVEQLHVVLDSRREFTSDDILEPLEKRGVTTGDTRAIAAILLAAKRSGLIEPSGIYVRCRRPSRHNAPVMVWKNKRFKTMEG